MSDRELEGAEGGVARVHDENTEPTQWYRIDTYHPSPIPVTVGHGDSFDGWGEEFRPGSTHFDTIEEAWDRLIGRAIDRSAYYVDQERDALRDYLNARHEALTYRSLIVKLLARRIQAIEDPNQTPAREPASEATLRRLAELVTPARDVETVLTETALAVQAHEGHDDPNIAADLIELATRFRNWRNARPHLDPALFGP